MPERARRRAEEGLAPDVQLNDKYLRLAPAKLAELKRRATCACGRRQIVGGPDDILHESRCVRCGRGVRSMPYDRFLAELEDRDLAKYRRGGELRERRDTLGVTRGAPPYKREPNRRLKQEGTSLSVRVARWSQGQPPLNAEETDWARVA